MKSFDGLVVWANFRLNFFVIVIGVKQDLLMAVILYLLILVEMWMDSEMEN